VLAHSLCTGAGLYGGNCNCVHQAVRCPVDASTPLVRPTLSHCRKYWLGRSVNRWLNQLRVCEDSSCPAVSEWRHTIRHDHGAEMMRRVLKWCCGACQLYGVDEDDNAGDDTMMMMMMNRSNQ